MIVELEEVVIEHIFLKGVKTDEKLPLGKSPRLEILSEAIFSMEFVRVSVFHVKI